MAFFSFVICVFELLLLFLSGINGLSSSKSPGAQFDLSNWKLTLPDSSASEKSPAQLEAGFESQYFETASDGSMKFYVPGGGGTTDTAKYPRSEFRQLCNPTTSNNPDRYNWKVSSGTYTVSAKYKIGDIDSSSRKIVIQQIHAYDGPPLIKIKWEKHKVYALVKTDSSGDNEESYLMGDAPQYEQFLCKITVKDGYLKLYLNNVKKYDIKVKDYWSSYGNYFKAGNYIQSNSNSAYSYVYIYYLYVKTDGSCSYTSDSLIFDENTITDNSTNHIANIIAIVCIILFAILCIIGAAFCIYKKKYSSNKKEVSFKDEPDDEIDDNDNTNINIDADGDDQETLNDTNKKPAYNMEEIEIEMNIEAEDDDEDNNDDDVTQM